MSDLRSLPSVDVLLQSDSVVSLILTDRRPLTLDAAIEHLSAHQGGLEDGKILFDPRADGPPQESDLSKAYNGMIHSSKEIHS